MDRLPEQSPTNSSRFIAKAISLAGPDAVRAAMQCSKEDFLRYRQGAKAPTWRELCWLIELVVAEQRRKIARNRQLLAAQRARRFGPNGVPMDEPVRYALGRAFEKAGGMGPLASELQVPLPDLLRWLDGAEKPPRHVLAKVGEILVEEVSSQR